ncbi:hypothetical protein PT015_00175 [Candidatus Mycobacterium wuenschmannii]|uniref:Proline rich protein n=1 Tax=Candidatus Mycobacterium wuenschmannii TaxID=3027808 RepID=A0ABY8VYJ8_9MYCO|nr:hypothetical protein [Candidatus Mycobacterium wuenschmannii]WIM87996.1 hypothetical protein PT015_00175 [Candidatus Mycobacterium wuenschmannii]
MKLTLNVLERNNRDTDKHWPNYMFGGRVRTSTLVLIVLFFATWWTYNTYRPHPPPPAAPAVVPPGYVPDPNYTWVPRTRVQQPEPRYETPTRAPSTTVVPPPPTSTSPTTTTPPPLIQLPVLPPPFGPGTTTPSPSPGPSPSPRPAPALPGLPGFPR